MKMRRREEGQRVEWEEGKGMLLELVKRELSEESWDAG